MQYSKSVSVPVTALKKKRGGGGGKEHQHKKKLGEERLKYQIVEVAVVSGFVDSGNNYGYRGTSRFNALCD